MLALSLYSMSLVGGLLWFKFHAVLEMRASLQRLDYTLALARSLALTSNPPQEFKICPEESPYWQNGWNIQNQAGLIVKKIPYTCQTIIDLTMLDHKKNGCINILTNGMSHNNGHFTYQIDVLFYTITGKLVFNKGLRTYTAYTTDDQH
jgi:hypothetical protein